MEYSSQILDELLSPDNIMPHTHLSFFDGRTDQSLLCQSHLGNCIVLMLSQYLQEHARKLNSVVTCYLAPYCVSTCASLHSKRWVPASMWLSTILAFAMPSEETLRIHTHPAWPPSVRRFLLEPATDNMCFVLGLLMHITVPCKSMFSIG